MHLSRCIDNTLKILEPGGNGYLLSLPFAETYSGLPDFDLFGGSGSALPLSGKTETKPTPIRRQIKNHLIAN